MSEEDSGDEDEVAPDNLPRSVMMSPATVVLEDGARRDDANDQEISSEDENKEPEVRSGL